MPLIYLSPIGGVYLTLPRKRKKNYRITKYSKRQGKLKQARDTFNIFYYIKIYIFKKCKATACKNKHSRSNKRHLKI